MSRSKKKRIENLSLLAAGQKKYCQYLDYLATVEKSYVAAWKERPRYANMLVLKLTVRKQ